MSISLSRLSRHLAVAGLSLTLTAGAANAALMSVSNSAPIVNNADIAQLSGGFDLGGNEAHVWSNRPVQGQTFTTLGNAGGYTLSNLTFATHSGGFGANSTSPSWTVRLGTVSGGVFTPIVTETNFGVPVSPSQYITWTLASPVTLAPNTVYGIDVAPTGSGYVSANSNDPNSYTGGVAYSTGTNATPNNASLITRSGDRVFHVDLVEGALAQSSGQISINFSGGRNDGNFGTHTVTGTAGAVPLANWNNIAGPSYGSPDVFGAPLVDSTGAATSAVFSMNIGNTWDSGGPSATDNDRMIRSYIDNAQGTQIAVAGLDSRFTDVGYSVIVYYDTDSNGVFQIGATDNLGNTDSGWAYENGNFAGTFLESLAQTEAEAIDFFNRGATSNYVTLTGLMGGQFSLSLLNGNSNGDDRARISGIQIIANPAAILPEPATAMLGVMGVAGLAFRRRRAV